VITMSATIAIGRVSALTGVNIETIRYYERIGLVPRQPKSAGGRREYDPVSVKRLSFIRRARDIGFSIEDIRSLLALSEPNHRSCAEVRNIAEIHRDAIMLRVADLNRLQTLLTETINKCSGRKIPHCAVLDMLASEKSRL